MKTVSSLCRNQPTLVQLEILARADRHLKEKCGRYFGGILTEAEVFALTVGLKLNEASHD